MLSPWGQAGTTPPKSTGVGPQCPAVSVSAHSCSRWTTAPADGDRSTSVTIRAVPPIILLPPGPRDPEPLPPAAFPRAPLAGTGWDSHRPHSPFPQPPVPRGEHRHGEPAHHPRKGSGTWEIYCSLLTDLFPTQQPPSLHAELSLLFLIPPGKC